VPEMDADHDSSRQSEPGSIKPKRSPRATHEETTTLLPSSIFLASPVSSWIAISTWGPTVATPTNAVCSALLLKISRQLRDPTQTCLKQE
jgi:hypothetical protein